MEVLEMAGRMSRDRETEVKARIPKMEGRSMVETFLLVVDAMHNFDPCIWDLKYLVILNEICNAEADDIQDILLITKDKIKKMETMSFLNLVQLQGRIYGKPPSYTTVKEALNKL